MIRFRRLAGVLSMKLTVSRRGVGPQYFPVRTAIRWGSITRSAATATTGPNTGALTGLILTAVSAAFTTRRLATDFRVQPSLPLCGPLTPDPLSARSPIVRRC
jgi:hypothetical protein